MKPWERGDAAVVVGKINETHKKFKFSGRDLRGMRCGLSGVYVKALTVFSYFSAKTLVLLRSSVYLLLQYVERNAER
jgi:hypothetical protein